MNGRDDSIDPADPAAPNDLDPELLAVEARVRAARLATDPAFDRRLLAELGLAPVLRRRPALSRLAAGFLIATTLCGAVAAAVVAVVRHRGAVAEPAERGPAPPSPVVATPPSPSAPPAIVERAAEKLVDAAPAAAPSASDELADPDGPDVEEETPSSSFMSGWPLNVDVVETLHAAPIVARVKLTGKAGKPAKPANASTAAAQPGPDYDLLRGEIVALYQGDEDLLDRTVILHAKWTETRKSFLCWSGVGDESMANGQGTWIVPLELTNVGLAPDGPVHLRVALGEFLPGTLVRPDLPPRKPTPIEQDVVKALRDDLVATLSAPEAAARRMAIRALRNWRGARIEHDVSELWRDPPTAAALLAAGQDSDANVRWTVAWMTGPAAGEAGKELLLQLLFDRDSMVRQPAASQLAGFGDPELLAVVESVRDWALDEYLSNTALGGKEAVRGKLDDSLRQLKTHEQQEIRARIAWSLESAAPAPELTAGLLAALADSDVEVRRGAAHSLGVVAKPEAAAVTDALDGLPATEDPRVRVVAAEAQVALGDKRGYAHLSRLVAGDDARAAAQACGALGRLAKRDAVELLLKAAADPRPAVRGAAVTALADRAKRSTSPHAAAVTALLERAVKDDHVFVRAAAQAALRARSRLSADEAKQIGRIGYIEEGDDE